MCPKKPRFLSSVFQSICLILLKKHRMAWWFLNLEEISDLNKHVQMIMSIHSLSKTVYLYMGFLVEIVGLQKCW